MLTLVVVLSNVLGNLALSAGIKGGDYMRAFLNPLVWLGITLLILWLVSRMTLMSWADLSYLLPVTSIGYVLSAVCGRLFLNEQISGWRWAGALLITAGMALVGTTSPKT